MLRPFLAADGGQDASWRQPDGRRHDRKSFRLGTDPGNQVPGLTAVFSPRAEDAAFAAILFRGRDKGGKLVLAVYDVVRAGCDSLSVERGESVGTLPGSGAVLGIIEARKTATARHHPQRDGGIGRRKIEAARTCRS